MRTFIVVGTDKETQQPRRLEVSAPDDIAARQKGNMLGVIVTEVVDVAPPSTATVTRQADAQQAQDHWQRLIRSPEHRAMRRAVFWGTLQAMVVFSVMMFVLRLVWLALFTR